MLTLAEFLLARIAEDAEWLAQQSGDLEWCQECGFGEQPGSPYSLSRLTAECEAKRRIVDWAAPKSGLTVRAPTDRPGVYDTRDVRYVSDDGEDLLKILALPYAEHPDYQEDWRP